MICKIAEPDVETEDLSWHSLGSNGLSVSSVNPAKKSPTSVKLPSSPNPSARLPGDRSSAGEALDAVALKRLLTEMEAKHGSEMDSARKSGLDQGLKQGRQEANAEMEQALNRLAQTIQEISHLKRQVRSGAENEVVKLSLSIARRILHREITADPQSLRGVVYAALQRLQNREITKIRVFPASVPAVRSALERNGGLAAIEIIADGVLPPGGLLLETSQGELDASVETQLQEIERGFADRLQLR